VAALALTVNAGRAGDTFLEFEPVWGTNSLRLEGSPLPATDGSLFTVSRLDLLISEVALQQEDGTWLDSRDWTAFLSLGRQRWRAQLEGMPARSFRKIRFTVGLPPDLNASDPNQYPSGHPLHPQENGLHWGWQGGYIFLALEGRAQQTHGERSGFSYHLGNSENRVRVEFPAAFDGARHRTVRVKFDVAQLFSPTHALSPWRDGTSTHSRPGDPVVPGLKSGVASAFSLSGLSTDQYQETAPPSGPPAEPAHRTGTPLALRISARLPKVSLPADNPLTEEGVALGARLFQETRLSSNNQLSCSSCHEREHAFADRAKFSAGVDGQLGRRNAMPLFNLAWQKEFFWDGRVTGLRHQTLAPIQDAHEMAETLDRVVSKLSQHRDYPPLFKRAFGTETVTAERVGLALEQFLFTLISQESKFDRAARGDVPLSEQEQRGLRLFVTENDPARGLRGADCFHCHGGNLFTSGAYANNGLDRVSSDLGRAKVTGLATDEGKFRVPSLRNVAVSAPYMHDGRFATLEEVVAHYNRGIQSSATLDPNLAKHPQLGLNLSQADEQALVAFLRTLTDDSFLQTQNSHLTQK
jgi:cytochrome c peroxidase